MAEITFEIVSAWILNNPSYLKEIQQIVSAVKASKKPKNNSKEYPENLKEQFRAEGKIEILENVWLTKQELDTLEALYGVEVVNEKLLEISDWPTNPNPDKAGKPSYLKYRKYVDHYRLIKNSIKRNLGE